MGRGGLSIFYVDSIDRKPLVQSIGILSVRPRQPWPYANNEYITQRRRQTRRKTAQYNVPSRDRFIGKP